MQGESPVATIVCVVQLERLWRKAGLACGALPTIAGKLVKECGGGRLRPPEVREGVV